MAKTWKRVEVWVPPEDLEKLKTYLPAYGAQSRVLRQLLRWYVSQLEHKFKQSQDPNLPDLPPMKLSEILEDNNDRD